MNTCSRSAASREVMRRKRVGRLHRAAFLYVPIFLAVAARPLGAQEADLQHALSAYSPADAARIEALVMSPRWEGFPTDLLVAKTAEGAAKGVRADVLLAALEDYAGRLDRAHRILGDQASATSLEATAHVLEHDVSESLVRTVAAANAKDEQLTAAMIVLDDLLSAGVPPSQAGTLLLDAATQQRRSEDVLHIPALVRRWMRQGYQPTDAAAQVKRAMELPQQRNGGTLDLYRNPRQPNDRVLEPSRPPQPNRPFY